MPEAIHEHADGAALRAALWYGYNCKRIYIEFRAGAGQRFTPLGYFEYTTDKAWKLFPERGRKTQMIEQIQRAYPSSAALMEAMGCVQEIGYWRPPTGEEIDARWRRLQRAEIAAMSGIEVLDRPTPDADRLLKGLDL